MTGYSKVKVLSNWRCCVVVALRLVELHKVSLSINLVTFQFHQCIRYVLRS